MVVEKRGIDKDLADGNLVDAQQFAERIARIVLAPFQELLVYPPDGLAVQTVFLRDLRNRCLFALGYL